MYAKHYENPTVLSKVIAKNVGDVFLRHTVYYIMLLIVWVLSFTAYNKTIVVLFYFYFSFIAVVRSA